MCYRSTTQCCCLSVFTGCNGKGYLILTLICCSFAISSFGRYTLYKNIQTEGGGFAFFLKKKSKLSTLPLTQMHPNDYTQGRPLSHRINTHAQPSSNRRCASHSNGLTSGQILTRTERSRERERPRGGEQIERFISGVHSLHV